MYINIVCVADNKNMWINHPTYNNAINNEDCGLDIPLPHDVSIPGCCQSFPLNLGIKTASSSGYMLVPRSSISKIPIRMSNSIGIIDKNYRGELVAMVDNISKNCINLEAGKCYFQIVSFDGILPEMQLSESLDETMRGEGGFGSTTPVSEPVSTEVSTPGSTKGG